MSDFGDDRMTCTPGGVAWISLVRSFVRSFLLVAESPWSARVIALAVIASGCASSHGRDDLDGAGPREAGLLEVGALEVGPVEVGAGEVGAADVPDAPLCPPERCDGIDQDCDGLVDDGAECTISGASAACVDGACRFVACDGTHADCNADVSDGCEVDTASDRERCGGCGLLCGMTETCEAGVCVREQIVDMAPGGFMSCVLLGSGRVLCWGTNEYGSLGPDYALGESFPAPVEIHGLPRNVVAISDTTDASGFALTAEGELWAWGSNDQGSLGLGFESSAEPPSRVPLSTAIASVHTAGQSTCAVDVDRRVWCWGDAAGTGKRHGRPTPALVELGGAAQLVTGTNTWGWFALVGERGFTWGWDQHGLRGAAPRTGLDTPVAPFAFSSAVMNADCGATCCAVLAGGAITCWGRDYLGALGDGPPDDATWGNTWDLTLPLFHDPVLALAPPGPVDLAMMGAVNDDEGACARYADGQVFCWGGERVSGLGHQASSAEELTLPAPATGLYGGRGGCVRLEGDTRLLCWGRNVWGELGDGTLRPSLVPVPVVGFE